MPTIAALDNGGISARTLTEKPTQTQKLIPGCHIAPWNWKLVPVVHAHKEDKEDKTYI